MAFVEVKWQCPACESMNPKKISKPNYFNPSLVNCECEICDSKWLVRFRRGKTAERRGKNVQLELEFIRGDLSPEGQRYTKERQEKETKPPQGELTP